MATKLTQKQKEAVYSASPAVLVVAGPGTGKTEILGRRIEYLVKEKNIDPQNILALTYTESGAANMRDRVVGFLNEAGYEPSISTFHSFASQLIDQHPDIFGYKSNLKALTTIERAKLIQKIIDNLHKAKKLKLLISEHEKYFYWKDIENKISKLKREGVTTEEFNKIVKDWQKEFDSMPDEEKLSSRGPRKGLVKREHEKLQEKINKNTELALIYEEYEKTLKNKNVYDYEDMILKAIEGIKNSPTLQADLHQQYKAILVDEYQDTNGAQNKLLFSLIEPQNTMVFAVGDDDQAIARFQGATIENFAEFKDHLPDAEIVVLKENFRSPQFILNAALSLAQKNQNRLISKFNLEEKSLEAKGDFANEKSFYIHEFEKDPQEHAYLVEELKKLHKDGAGWGDTAILVRTNKEQKNLSEILRQNNIPHMLSAEQDALEEPRVAKFFSIVRACINPLDDQNLFEFLMHPATPILTEDVIRVMDARGRDENIYNTLKRVIENKDSNLSDIQKAQLTLNMLLELSASQATTSGAHWMHEILQKTGFLNWALQQPDAVYLIANLRALTDEAKRVQEGNPQLRMADLLEHFNSYKDLGIALKASLKGFEFEDAVHLITAHNAKGREFKNVFIVHAIEKNWSGKSAREKLTLPQAIAQTREDEEDARRVFYVALTRAKKNLYITYSLNYLAGISGLEEKERETLPSRFIKELSTGQTGRQDIVPKKTKQNAKEFLLKSLSPNQNILQEKEKEVIKNIVSRPKFSLNATALNKFLECPRNYLYEKIMRVPTVRTFALTYGNAVQYYLKI